MRERGEKRRAPSLSSSPSLGISANRACMPSPSSSSSSVAAAAGAEEEEENPVRFDRAASRRRREKEEVEREKSIFLPFPPSI